MTFDGTELRSTAEGTPDAEAPATQRLPSTSTSVRFAPTLRSETSTAPAPIPDPSCGTPELPGTLNWELIAEPVIGSCCNASPRFVSPVRSRSEEDISITAAASLSGFLRMREPVTTTSSRVSSTAACSCASAGSSGAVKLKNAAAMAAAVPLVVGKNRFITSPPEKRRQESDEIAICKGPAALQENDKGRTALLPV